MDASFEHKVRQRAYDIWVAAGRENGLAELHWLSAEQAVMGEITIPNAKVVKAVKARAAKPAPGAKVTAAADPKKPAARKAKKA